MKANYKKWMGAVAFWLLVCLSANGQNADRTKGAVRVMTREVAIRVFTYFAQTDKDPTTNRLTGRAKLAQKIADSLRKGPDVDPFLVIQAIDRVIAQNQRPQWDAAISKLKELSQATLEENSTNDTIIAALEKNLFDWRQKYGQGENGNNAYKPKTIPKEEVSKAISDWLKQHSSADPSSTASSSTSGSETSSNGSSITTSAATGGGGSENSFGFGVLWFFVGAIIGLRVALWFWYRPKIELAENWEKVSKKVREKGFKLTPSHPDTGLLNVGQLLDLLETYKQPSHDNSSKSVGSGNMTNPNDATVKEIRILLGLGGGDLVEAVRGLKVEAQRSAREKQELETKLDQINKAPPETKIVTQQSPQSQPKTFAFFSQPNPEGWFDDSERFGQSNPDTCYRFTFLPKGAGTATFNVEANPERMPRILNFRNMFLDPACESENNYQTGHSRVVTLNEGKAKLNSNGQWRVETKAKIRFE